MLSKEDGRDLEWIHSDVNLTLQMLLMTIFVVITVVPMY